MDIEDNNNSGSGAAAASEAALTPAERERLRKQRERAAEARELIRQGMGRAVEDEEAYVREVAGEAGGRGFEVVPAEDVSEGSDDESGEEEEEEGGEGGSLAGPEPLSRASEASLRDELKALDRVRVGSAEHAKLLALGSLMMRHSGAKAVLDSAYNRYAYPERGEELPAWFADDEVKFNKPQLPVTKAMVDKIRQQYQDLATKPMKKVAEARARKRKRAQQQLKKVKARMENAMEDETLERAKLRVRAARRRALAGEPRTHPL